jgi:hypothetical protein
LESFFLLGAFFFMAPEVACRTRGEDTEGRRNFGRVEAAGRLEAGPRLSLAREARHWFEDAIGLVFGAALAVDRSVGSGRQLRFRKKAGSVGRAVFKPGLSGRNCRGSSHRLGRIDQRPTTYPATPIAPPKS